MKEYRYPSPIIADRIQQIMWDNNLTDVYVARILNVDRKTILAVRHAERNPSIKFVRWLCSTFHIDANWLLVLTDHKTLPETIRTIHDCVAKQMYEKGIDDYMNALLNVLDDFGSLSNPTVRQIAERLKEQKK